MLPGFNTNVRHKGVLFHVQSEDSGRAHPHVITHLYHGGTILFSEKSSYADLVDADDLPARVRELMDTQHRAILARLRRGAFDDVIRERLGPVMNEGASTRPTASATAPLEESTEPPLEHNATPPPLDERAHEPARPFGESVVSAKPLDEVILDYLVENARKRRQKPAS
jgi:hypothetical protein